MIRFGPVYGGDIGDYLQRGEKKTDEMRHVHFSALERFEMSVAWAAPLTLLLVPLALLIRPGWCLPLVALTWFLALVVHYVADRIPAYPRLSIGATAIVLSTGTAGLTGGGWVTIGFAALAATILTSVLAFDVEGSSPTGAPSNFDGHEWRITLDLDRCVGAYRCWEVCPEACFDKRADAKKIELARPDQCIRCGACVVQCPVDALFFRDSDGESVSPETIRRFKLNLLGRRNIKSGSDFPVESPPARSGSR
jgi:NAD-dependent dihydropyrimidine dehydrogenase PreA subunit